MAPQIGFTNLTPIMKVLSLLVGIVAIVAVPIVAFSGVGYRIDTVDVKVEGNSSCIENLKKSDQEYRDAMIEMSTRQEAIMKTLEEIKDALEDR